MSDCQREEIWGGGSTTIGKEAREDGGTGAYEMEFAAGESTSQSLLHTSLILIFQKGFVPLPKSVTHSRIEENADVYDFELTAEDMKSLATTDYSPCAWDPTVSDD